MKRNYLRTMAIAVAAIFAGHNVYLVHAKTDNISADVLMANVEALANGESGEAIITCSAKCNDGVGKCWIKNGNDHCIFSGSQFDNCTGYGCKKYDGTIYY